MLVLETKTGAPLLQGSWGEKWLRWHMVTINILTLYMVRVFATWSYFLDKGEDG